MSSSKVALVTGASRGIGAVVARGLAEDGYDLIVTARTEKALAGLASEITSATGRRVEVLPLDLSDTELILSSLIPTLERVGPVDLLFNNAAINKGGTLEITAAEYEELLRVNVVAAREVVKAVVPGMKERRSGSIISLSSYAGKVGYPSSGVYGSTKFALSGFTESLFNELVPLGIKVSSICPSWVDTDMASKAPFNRERLIRPEDILETVRYLERLSPQACVGEILVQ